MKILLTGRTGQVGWELERAHDADIGRDRVEGFDRAANSARTRGRRPG